MENRIVLYLGREEICNENQSNFPIQIHHFINCKLKTEMHRLCRRERTSTRCILQRTRVELIMLKNLARFLTFVNLTSLSTQCVSSTQLNILNDKNIESCNLKLCQTFLVKYLLALAMCLKTII